MYKGGYQILDLGKILVHSTTDLNNNVQFSSNYTGNQLKEKIKEIITNKKPILLKCIDEDNVERIKFVEYHKYENINFEIVIYIDFDIDEETKTITAYYKTNLYYNIMEDNLTYHNILLE